MVEKFCQSCFPGCMPLAHQHAVRGALDAISTIGIVDWPSVKTLEPWRQARFRYQQRRQLMECKQVDSTVTAAGIEDKQLGVCRAVGPNNRNTVKERKIVADHRPCSRLEKLFFRSPGCHSSGPVIASVFRESNSGASQRFQLDRRCFCCFGGWRVGHVGFAPSWLYLKYCPWV